MKANPAAVGILIVLSWTAHALAQIQPYAGNPCYWEYGGRPILLVGASDRDNLFQWAGDDDRLVRHLDLLAQCGGNYVRCTMSSREYLPEGIRWNLLPYPFARVNGKYDLRQWNDTYWDKLRTFLAETNKREIIVQLELWDRWNESGDSERPGNGWYDSPWNPNNNSTYDWADSPLLTEGRTGFYNPFHLATIAKDPVLLPLQQQFVKRIVDTVIDGGFDHVIYQVDNESGIGDESLEPDPSWARFAREYAKTKGRGELYICTSRRFHEPSPYHTETFRDWNNPEIRVSIINDAFNYCDISQNNGTVGQEHYDNIRWYHSKVLEQGPRPINHVKAYHFNWPIGGNFHKRTAGTDAETGARLWRAIFAGAASFRFHRRTTFSSGILDGFGLSAPAQQHLRSLRLFLDHVHLFDLAPRNELLSGRSDDEAYCLAKPGRQLAVFFTGAGDRAVRLDLTSIEDAVSLRWLNVAECHFSPEEQIPQSNEHALSPPGPGHWVAVLTASGHGR